MTKSAAKEGGTLSRNVIKVGSSFGGIVDTDVVREGEGFDEVLMKTSRQIVGAAAQFFEAELTRLTLRTSPVGRGREEASPRNFKWMTRFGP